MTPPPHTPPRRRAARGKRGRDRADRRTRGHAWTNASRGWPPPRTGSAGRWRRSSTASATPTACPTRSPPRDHHRQAEAPEHQRGGHAPPASTRSRSRAAASHDGPPRPGAPCPPPRGRPHGKARADQVKEAATAKRPRRGMHSPSMPRQLFRQFAAGPGEGGQLGQPLPRRGLARAEENQNRVAGPALHGHGRAGYLALAAAHPTGTAPTHRKLGQRAVRALRAGRSASGVAPPLLGRRTTAAPGAAQRLGWEFSDSSPSSRSSRASSAPPSSG